MNGIHSLLRLVALVLQRDPVFLLNFTFFDVGEMELFRTISEPSGHYLYSYLRGVRFEMITCQLLCFQIHRGASSPDSGSAGPSRTAPSQQPHRIPSNSSPPQRSHPPAPLYPPATQLPTDDENGLKREPSYRYGMDRWCFW